MDLNSTCGRRVVSESTSANSSGTQANNQGAQPNEAVREQDSTKILGKRGGKTGPTVMPSSRFLWKLRYDRVIGKTAEPT